MKRIIFVFLPFLPCLASAQVAKDTVTVLTIAQIPAGAIRDTTNITFVQDNAFAKANFDSLAKYTRVKLLAAGAITSAELATALSNETGTGAAVFATNPTITLGAATGLPIATGLTGLGAANRIPYATSATAMTTGAGLTFDGTNFATTGTATATKFIPTGGAVTGNGMYLPAANTVGISANGVLQQTLHPTGLTIFKTTPQNKNTTSRLIEIGAQGSIYSAPGAAGRFNDYTFGMGFYFDETPSALPRYMHTETVLTHQPARFTLYQGQFRFDNAVVGTKDSVITWLRLLTIEETGDVGIGVSAPSEKLHVVGNARITAVGTASASNSALYITNTGVLSTNSSDVDKKHNIRQLPYGLSTINNLNPVAFNWNDDDSEDIGFVAQDISQHIPETVISNWNGDLIFRQEKIIPVLVKAIQEQQAQIEQLKQRITQLENK